MEVRGEADMSDEVQVVGGKTVVYMLHPNCNVENFGGGATEDTQVAS